MVGHLGQDDVLEKKYAEILGKYFDRPDTIFIFSSDFCHWGSFYGY